MTSIPQDRTMQTIARALDGLALRHRVVASNLANQATPGYRRREVRFEDLLLEGRIDRDFRPEVRIDDRPGGPNGNNVVPEEELSLLTRVEVVYRALTLLAARKAQMMRQAMQPPR